MSGAATAQWDIETNQLDLVKKQAQLLRCPDNNISDMLKCLKQVCYFRFPLNFSIK